MHTELRPRLVPVDVARVRAKLRKPRTHRTSKRKIRTAPAESAATSAAHSGCCGSHLRRNASGVPQSDTITDIGNPLGVIAWCSGAEAKIAPTAAKNSASCGRANPRINTAPGKISSCVGSAQVGKRDSSPSCILPQRRIKGEYINPSKLVSGPDFAPVPQSLAPWPLLYQAALTSSSLVGSNSR